MTVSRETMRAVLQEHVDAENDADAARVMATYSSSGPVFEDAASGARCVGEQIVDENYRHLWDGFPGLQREITRWTLGKDSAVIELTIRGKHEGPFRGIPASGKEVEFRIIAHFQFDAEGADFAGDGVLRHADVYAAVGADAVAHQELLRPGRSWSRNLNASI